MRVLVTGAAGYTGERLVRRLTAEGHSVRALVHNPRQAPALRALGARVVIGDVTNRASIAGIAANTEVVYHLVGTLAGGTGAMRRVMLAGTEHLLDQCRAAGAGNGGPLRAFIFTSNAVVYGDGGGKLLDERSPCNPSFPLGQVNCEVEQALSAAQLSRNGTPALPITMLRLGAIYGPGRLSSSRIQQGRFRIIGSGSNWSSRIHVDDLVETLLALGLQPRPGRLFCVADEEPCAVREYYGRLAALLAAPAPGHIPAWYALARGKGRGALARLRRRPPFVDQNVVGLFTTDLRLDGACLRHDLALQLRYPSFREGLPAALAEEQSAPRL